MDLTPDPKIDVSEAITVTLGGRDWLVPPLMLREMCKIWSPLPIALKALNRLDSVFTQWRGTVQPDGSIVKGIADEDLLERLDLSEVEMNAIIRVIHGGLSRVYRKLTLNDIEEMPITVMALIPALRVIVDQSHATERKSASVPVGEA